VSAASGHAWIKDVQWPLWRSASLEAGSKPDVRIAQKKHNSNCVHAAVSTHGGFGSVAWFFRRPKVGKKLYVGNLSYEVTTGDLEKMFQPHGTVESAQVIADRDTGRSKGFGFVEMGSNQEAQAATQALNGKESNGRALTVNEAKPREERSGGRRESGGGNRY
jgi:cold-inducible RNA-binding protein